MNDSRRGIWDFSIYDAIVIHFSLRLSLQGHVPPTIIKKLHAYNGPKVLFIQDEYDHTNMTRQNMQVMGINVIFTCVPPEGREIVYPRSQFPDLEFQSTLTGYVPMDVDIEKNAKPITQRKNLIGYRGRQLPHQYGMLGYEKYIIGKRMKEEAEARGVTADIEVDDSKRIYGSWYTFLGNCRATLGTESGANIFDFEGDLKQLAEKLSDKPFDEVYEEHFSPFEGIVEMNQISPKFFEAILLRTALVCFPGTYSDILEANRHYIPLEKDFSNVDEVFEKINNVAFIKKITSQAYQDIVASGKYTYRQFISDFDDWLDAKVPVANCEIISAPIAIRRRGRIIALPTTDPRDKVLSTGILAKDYQRIEFAKMYVRPVHAKITPGTRQEGKSSERVFEENIVIQETISPSGGENFSRRLQLASASSRAPLYLRIIKKIWRIMPISFRQFILDLIGKL